MAKYILSLVVLALFSCNETPKISASGLIEKTIRAHGWEQKKPASISFDFRDHHYAILRSKKGTTYTRETHTAKDTVLDIWDNFRDFKRYKNGVETVVTDSLAQLYANAINSVAYFTQLPLGLQDAAVLATYQGKTPLNGLEYETLKITFKQEGGGEDYNDTFYYWVHPQRFTIDFMAYTYATNGGGTRFRAATKAQTVAGVRFQDYENYKPEKHPSSLDSLPFLYETGKLILLSTIENKNLKLNFKP